MTDEVLVSLEHARKSFGDTLVLEDISLSVRKGEVVAIIGPSGGGKSTLLRCLALLETLDGGSLSYGDVTVATDDGLRSVYAGKAALAAAEDLGFDTQLYRHDGIADGVKADVIIYTLPSAVDGIDKLDCGHLIEANYKNPCLSGHKGYIPGTAWHLQQALLGYGIMSGETPDIEAMRKVYL